MAQRTSKRLDSEALFAYALRALGARAYSVGELRRKLESRAEKASDTGAVIARLKEYGYLDDRKYAETVAASRLENHGLGRARVLHDLRKRRVAPAVAEKAVAEAYRGTDEDALVEAYLQRKYRTAPLNVFLSEPKNLASAYRRLRGAGFSSASSLRVLKRFAREPEMLDSLADSDEDGRAEE